MPAKNGYTAEFKDQAVRYVLEEMEPDESRKHGCDRLGVPPPTLARTLRFANAIESMLSWSSR